MRALLAAVALIAAIAAFSRVQAQPANHRPVKAVGPDRLTVTTPSGSGQVALFVAGDWTRPRPDITSALIILHGYLRNADAYLRDGERAVAAAGPDAAGTLVIAPQFLADIDATANNLPASVLRWTTGSWEGGDNALGPAPISSYAALDAVVAHLADRTRFPNLHEIVIAGHSGGAQVAQRYAILAPNPPAGIAIRYVVANPSSYAYFVAARPRPVDATACPRFNTWKYGMLNLPPYAAGASPAALEPRYAARDVIQLLGTADTNPHHPALDVTCMGEAQGPYRLARGLAYAHMLRARQGDADHQRVFLVQGVGHDANRMFNSACGLAALFDKPGVDKPGVDKPGCAPTEPLPASP
jgi:pimeloyl-ACP methyl ester carboxylesterase